MCVYLSLLCVCSSVHAVGVIYVTVIAPIIAVMAVIVVIVLQILFLPLTLLTGQRPNQINIQEVFNEAMPTPLRFFQHLFGAIRIGRSGPTRRHTGVANQHRPGRVRSVTGLVYPVVQVNMLRAEPPWHCIVGVCCTQFC